MGNKKGHWCLAVSVYIDGTFKAKIDIMHRKLNLVKRWHRKRTDLGSGAILTLLFFLKIRKKFPDLSQ